MSANSTDLNAEIAKDVTFEIQGKTFTQNFYVCNIRTHDVIWGVIFSKKHETLLDFGRLKLLFRNSNGSCC